MKRELVSAGEQARRDLAEAEQLWERKAGKRAEAARRLEREKA